MEPQVFFHISWTTRDRTPRLTREAALFLDRFLRAAAGHRQSHVLEIGMVRNAVHLVLWAHPSIEVPQLVERFKESSAAAAAEALGLPDDQLLHWAEGFSSVPVPTRDLEAVRESARRLHEHHPAEAIPGWQGGDEAWEMIVA